MIVWIVTKLVCWLYGIDIRPGLDAFCVCLSWIEMLLVAIWVVIKFLRLIEKVIRLDCAIDDRRINNGNCSEAEEAEDFLQKVKNLFTTQECKK